MGKHRIPQYLKWPLAILIGVSKSIITFTTMIAALFFANRLFGKKKK